MFEPGYTGDGFTHQADEDAAEQAACERAVEGLDELTITEVPQYEVLSATLHGEPVAVADYRHNAPFVDGDTRTIRYEGDEPIEQVFQGDTATGGWYDQD